MSKQYTDAEKAEYWRKKAQRKGKKSYKKKAYVPRSANDSLAEQKNKSPGFIASAGNAAGGAIGTALGGPAGTAIGSFLGGKLGHLVEKITGFGDYKIQQNSIMKGGMAPAQIVNSTEKGGVIVRHREYLGDIPATTDFAITKYPLNPGLVGTFPWLANIANNFEQYRFRGMIFEFNSTSSDAVLSSATSSALGTVAMATDYDVLDAVYTTKREMLNSQFANSRKPSESFIHPIECKKEWIPYNLNWTRHTESYPAGGDPRTYDLGNFYVATEGMQAASGNIGELWVCYEVELFKQQLLPLGSEVAADHLYINAPTNTTWLGNDTSEFDSTSTLGGWRDSGTYYFPANLQEGVFLVTYSVIGTSATIGEISNLLSNCERIDVWNTGASLFLQSPPSGTASVSLMASLVVKLTGANAAIGFLTANIPTAGKGDLWITELPQAMANPA